MTTNFSTARICGLFAVSTAALLCSLGAGAEAIDATAAAASNSAGAAQAPASPLASSPASAPRYTASDLQQAFNFMDANRDNKVSREEASAFRGVARHFDQADADKDGVLSRSEFDAAMNYVKPK